MFTNTTRGLQSSPRPRESNLNQRRSSFTFTFTPDKNWNFNESVHQFGSYMSERVRLEDETDRWRYRCPNGHTSWEPTNGHFWCVTCARTHNAEGAFDQLHDSKTGATLDRDQVHLETPAGDYEDLTEGSA